jgi:hypothetical protein
VQATHQTWAVHHVHVGKAERARPLTATSGTQEVMMTEDKFRDAVAQHFAWSRTVTYSTLAVALLLCPIASAVIWTISE